MPSQEQRVGELESRRSQAHGGTIPDIPLIALSRQADRPHPLLGRPIRKPLHPTPEHAGQGDSAEQHNVGSRNFASRLTEQDTFNDSATGPRSHTELVPAPGEGVSPVADHAGSIGRTEHECRAPRAENELQRGAPIGNEVPRRSLPLDDPHSDDESAAALEEEDRRPAARTYWSSIWLLKPTLGAFAALFAALAGSLGVLWASNTAQNGFATTLSSNHYTWTYGPTAILTLVVSLWRQVDYYCKAVQPWQELHRGPVDADRSVLLDYIGPMNIMSFPKAVRNRHLPVVASILGFALLKLGILVSTGLLVLNPTLEPRTIPVTLNNAFDSEICIPRSQGNLQWSKEPRGYLPTYDDPALSPIYAFFSAGDDQAQAPANIQDNVVFQSYDVHDKTLSVRSTTADVDVVRPALACEVADVKTLDASYTMSVNTPFMQLTTDTCVVGGDTSAGGDHIFFLLPQGTADTGWAVHGDVLRVLCDRSVNTTGAEVLNSQTHLDIRYAFIVFNGSVSSAPETFSDTFIDAPETFASLNQDASFQQVTAAICKLEYGTGKVTMLQDHENTSVDLENATFEGHWQAFTDLMLQEIVMSIVTQSNPDGVVGDDRLLRSLPEYKRPLTTQLPENATIERLLNPEILVEAASNLFSGVAARYLQQYCLMPTQATISAQAQLMEDRLHVSPVSIYIMMACFALLVGCAISLIWTSRQRLVPRDPSRLSTLATILARTLPMQDVLQYSGDLRTSQITEQLRSYEFISSTGTDFKLDVAKATSSPKVTTTKEKPLKIKQGPWNPLSARYYMVAITLLAPVLTLAEIELLYQISQRTDGIADVTGSETQATYLSQYITAAVMLAVATAFNSLDFTIASFAPYNLMWQSNLSRERSLEVHILGRLPPVALWTSLRNQHYSSALSNLCTIIGSVLTIVSSGLWVIDRYAVTKQPVQASLTSTWDTRWQNSSWIGDGGAAALMGSIDLGGATMPSSIWNDHVMPGVAGVQMLKAGDPQSSAMNNYTLEQASLRPVLSCEIVEDKYIDIETFKWAYSGPKNETLHFEPNFYPTYDSVTARPELSSTCQRAGPAGNLSYYTYGASTQYAFGQLAPWSIAGGLSGGEPGSTMSEGTADTGVVYGGGGSTVPEDTDNTDNTESTSNTANTNDTRAGIGGCGSSDPTCCRSRGLCPRDSTAPEDTDTGTRKDTSWVGHFFDLHLGPWTSSVNGMDSEAAIAWHDRATWGINVLSALDVPADFGEWDFNRGSQQDNPAGCPSIGVIFARMTRNVTTLDDVTVLLCSQQIEEVGLRVTYDSSSAIFPILNTDIAPVPIEGASRFLTNGTEGVDTFPYRPQTYTDPSSQGGGDVGRLPSFSQPSNAHVLDDLDGLFRHIVYRPNGTALEDMLGKANQSRLIESVQQAYSRYMSLVIDKQFRRNLTAEEGFTHVINGTVQLQVSRLKMTYGSKLALEIMLGVMTLLGAIAFVLADLRGTLPRKPTSIASAMGFFAGSDLCTGSNPLLSTGPRWPSEKELDEALDGWLFALGWWSKSVEAQSSGNESDNDGNENAEAARLSQESRGKRFGIDVGVLEQLRLRKRRNWWNIKKIL